MKNITTIIFVFFLFIKLEKGYIAKNSNYKTLLFLMMIW